MNSLEFVKLKSANFKKFVQEEILPKSTNKKAVHGYLSKLDYITMNTLSMSVVAGMFKGYLEGNNLNDYLTYLQEQFGFEGDLDVIKPKIQLFAQLLVDVVYPPQPIAATNYSCL